MISQLDLLLTIAVSLFAGVLVQGLADRYRVPSIGFLLLMGVLLGPEGIGLVQPAVLGSHLPPLITLLVVVVLFEGGMGLDRAGWRQASREIRGLLSVGVLVTWLVTAAAAAVLLSLPLDLALLTGSLVIITGPTVITPLLRRVRLQEPLPQILHWESVLIDPIGLFIALLCFEWMVLGGDGWSNLLAFLARLLVGLGTGALGGLVMARMLHAHWVRDDLANMTALGGVLFLFALCETIIAESGLLAVVMAGFVLSFKMSGRVRRLGLFNRQITPVLVGFLFIILASRLRLSDFLGMGWRELLLVALVMFLIRPLNVWLGTAGGHLSWRQRAVLGWVAPRGIVAVSMASLVAIVLARGGNEEAATLIQSFVYSVVVGTVVIQGGSARWVAESLGVGRGEPTGWLIIGANRLGRHIGLLLTTAGERVVMLCQNPHHAQLAENGGLAVVRGDPLDPNLEKHPLLGDVGQVLCMTENAAFNKLVGRHFGELVGARQVYRPGRPEERAEDFGLPVWQEMEELTRLLPAMQQGFATLRRERGAVMDAKPGEGVTRLPLFQLEEGGARLLKTPGERSDSGGGDGEFIFLERFESPLALLIPAPPLVFNVDIDLDDAALILARQMSTLRPVIKEEALVRALQIGKRLPVTAITPETVLVQTGLRHLSDSLCTVGVAGEGACIGREGSNVRLLFLLVYPAHDQAERASALELVIRLAQRDALVEELVNSQSPGAAHKLLHNHLSGRER